MTEKLAIREVVENWAMWRDAGFWDQFRTCWTDDGYMMATWFQGPAADFIKVSIEGWNKGVSILHFLGGSSIDVAGNRAISQTKMTISHARRSTDIWWTWSARAGFTISLKSATDNGESVLRQPIYEKDRMDAIDPIRRTR